MRLFAKQVRQNGVTMTVACQPAAVVMLHNFSGCPRLVVLEILARSLYSGLARLLLVSEVKDL